ncbi:MAG: copper chaperone PCu(A)C [Alphaproteobacteria bacterium]|nr:MAG: copper chaperone PCu(A)C [Alphaproteobacteria bacterium]
MVDGFIIHGPYARSSGPNARAGAIFMGIENQSGQDDRLIDVESDVAAVTQLHTHEIGADGVAHMRHVPEGFPVPDGEILWLERGGRHVMLMGLKEPLAEGDTVHLVLRFEKAGEVALDVPVDGDAAPMAHGHMHGDHAAGGHDHGHGHGNAPGADQ